ncbi:unnamed protein product, partial [Prorocentrum cordatum]
PKGPPSLTDQQIKAFASRDSAAYEAVAPTLSQSSRDCTQRQRGLLSGDPAVVSPFSQREHDLLQNKVGKAQKKYDKAAASVQSAAQWAAQCGMELGSLRPQQTEAAARAAAALAQLGTQLSPDSSILNPCGTLLQRSKALGATELEANLASMASELQALQEELESKGRGSARLAEAQAGGGATQSATDAASQPASAALAAPAAQATPPGHVREPSPPADVGVAERTARDWAARNEVKLLESVRNADGTDHDMDLGEGIDL